MSESELIAGEIERMEGGRAWHGPAIEQVLKGVTATQAAARPIAAAHSIWEIVLHLTAWVNEVEARLSRGARPLEAQADWPPVTATDETAWRAARDALARAHARLRQAIREFPATRLREQVAGTQDEPHSFYVMLHGLVQHDAYHAGQIALLKKALGH